MRQDNDVAGREYGRAGMQAAARKDGKRGGDDKVLFRAPLLCTQPNNAAEARLQDQAVHARKLIGCSCTHVNTLQAAREGELAMHAKCCSRG
jgi:hypothetical protein